MSLQHSTTWLENFVYLYGQVDRANAVCAAALANVPWPEVMTALADNQNIQVRKDSATPWGGDVWVWNGGIRC